jgi:hypothetical protein
MGLTELRYAAKVDLKKPAAEQPYLHVSFSVSGLASCDNMNLEPLAS